YMFSRSRRSPRHTVFPDTTLFRSQAMSITGAPAAGRICATLPAPTILSASDAPTLPLREGRSGEARASRRGRHGEVRAERASNQGRAPQHDAREADRGGDLL